MFALKQVETGVAVAKPRAVGLKGQNSILGWKPKCGQFT